MKAAYVLKNLNSQTSSNSTVERPERGRERGLHNAVKTGIPDW